MSEHLYLGTTYSKPRVNHNYNQSLQKQLNAFYEHRPGTAPKVIKASPNKTASRNPVTLQNIGDETKRAVRKGVSDYGVFSEKEANRPQGKATTGDRSATYNCSRPVDFKPSKRHIHQQSSMTFEEARKTKGNVAEVATQRTNQNPITQDHASYIPAEQRQRVRTALEPSQSYTRLNNRNMMLPSFSGVIRKGEAVKRDGMSQIFTDARSDVPKKLVQSKSQGTFNRRDSISIGYDAAMQQRDLGVSDKPTNGPCKSKVNVYYQATAAQVQQSVARRNTDSFKTNYF